MGWEERGGSVSPTSHVRRKSNKFCHIIVIGLSARRLEARLKFNLVDMVRVVRRQLWVLHDDLVTVTRTRQFLMTLAGSRCRESRDKSGPGEQGK